MNVLIWDTETSGLPNNKAGLESQPHIMQLAASLYNSERRPIFEFSVLLKLPEGVYPHPRALATHGISVEECKTFGLEKITGLNMLRQAALRADRMVAHNGKFDRQLLGFETQRTGVVMNIPETLHFCTMEAATPIVNLPPTEKMLAAGRTNPKPASLTECWQFFFGEPLPNAHDALVDTRGAARVYFEMVDRGMITE